MAEPRRADAEIMLRVTGLNVYYGRSHALQGVDLTLAHGVLSVVGRNGMGKTTLCKAIMGLARAVERLDPRARRRDVGPSPGAGRAARRRLRPARSPTVALAHRRRTLALDRGAPVRRLDGRACL